MKPTRSLLLFVLVSVYAQAEIPCCELPPPETNGTRDRAIWEQPVCPCPSGRPISYGRAIELAHVTIQPFGFVKWEGYWDTRQPLGAREEHLLLFPKQQLLDPQGIDINARGKWQMTSIDTRIGLALFGPTWNCIEVTGLIETDFRGPDDNGISALRLRHALGKVSWGSGSFLFGQWWHPLWILECFPHTVAFSIGAPIELQARDPQLRLTQRWNWFELIVAAASQRDYQSNGPIGKSTDYIRNSVTPNLHLQCRGYFGDNVVGIAADYKRLAPRIESNEGYSVKELIGSFIVEGFASFLHAPWSLRLKALWAENANDQLVLSGFGVRTQAPATGERTYSNTAGAGGWLDFSYLFGCDNKELGIFVGGIKNLGSRHRLFIDPTTKQPIIFSLTSVGQNIDYVTRVSPRFIYMRDPIRFGAEVEWTRASYGTLTDFGRVINTVPVDSVRILLVLYYMF